MNKESLLKLKYFLRGLGFGIIFCVIVFSFGSKQKTVVKQMSKEEIIKKASEYGMVDSLEHKLDEIANEEESPAPSKDPKPSNSPAPTVTPDVEPQSTPDSEGKIKEKYVTIKVESGQSSQRVAEALEQAGLISSAIDFNQYLHETGYSKKIQTGKKRIKAGGSFSYIAGQLISK